MAKKNLILSLRQATAFPSRLEWQPIFYPVMNKPYAMQIASEWNTKDPFSPSTSAAAEAARV